MIQSKVFSQEEINFILENYKGVSSNDLYNDLVREFKTKATLKQLMKFKQNNRLKSGTKRLFSEEERIFINENFKNISTKELHKLFIDNFGNCITLSQLRNYKINNDLKSGYQEFKKGQEAWNKGLKGVQKANKTSFKKGHLTWNKGKRGLQKANRTSFKNSNIPKHTAPIGSEREHHGYIKVKVSDGDNVFWKRKGRCVWEDYYKEKIPDGYQIMFKDSDIRNFAIDNLALVNRRDCLTMIGEGFSKEKNIGKDYFDSYHALSMVLNKIKDIEKEL